MGSPRPITYLLDGEFTVHREAFSAGLSGRREWRSTEGRQTFSPRTRWRSWRCAVVRERSVASWASAMRPWISSGKTSSKGAPSGVSNRMNWSSSEASVAMDTSSSRPPTLSRSKTLL